MMSSIRHTDEYNALDTALNALEEYMEKLSKDHAALAERVKKLEEVA